MLLGCDMPGAEEGDEFCWQISILRRLWGSYKPENDSWKPPRFHVVTPRVVFYPWMIVAPPALGMAQQYFALAVYSMYCGDFFAAGAPFFLRRFCSRLFVFCSNEVFLTFHSCSVVQNPHNLLPSMALYMCISFAVIRQITHHRVMFTHNRIRQQCFPSVYGEVPVRVRSIIFLRPLICTAPTSLR